MSAENIQTVLDFWFAARQMDEPNIDSRMACWFASDPEFDRELAERFNELTEEELKVFGS